MQLFRLARLVMRRQESPNKFAKMSSVTFSGLVPADGVPGAFNRACSLILMVCACLLDAGEPCGLQLLELGVPLADLDAIWITHAHADHVGGLPLLMQASWLHGRINRSPLGVPQHLAEPLRAWLDAILLTLRKFLVFLWGSSHGRSGKALMMGDGR